MMNGEVRQTSVFAGRSAPPSTFTDLQMGDDDNVLHQGAKSEMSEHIAQCADSFYIPACQQLHTRKQGEVRCRGFVC